MKNRTLWTWLPAVLAWAIMFVLFYLGWADPNEDGWTTGDSVACLLGFGGLIWLGAKLNNVI